MSKLNAKEKKWDEQIRDLGCIVCAMQGNQGVPCSKHHITRGGRRISELKTIGLCEPGHHKYSQKATDELPERFGYHDGPKEFERRYGTLEELLEETKRRIGWDD